MASTDSKTRRPGWWYPYIFVGLFGIVVAVNGVLYYYATSTFTGLETENAYDRGIGYNKVLAADKAQRDLGWTVKTAILPAGPVGDGKHPTRFEASFLDRAGQPLNGLGVRASLRRPTQAGHDRTVDLKWQGNGFYAAESVLDFPGQWDLRVVAVQGDLEYKTNQRIMIPSSQ